MLECGRKLDLDAASIRLAVQGASVGLVPVRGQQLAATIDYNTTTLNTSLPISVSGLSRRDQRLNPSRPLMQE
jgi:hypothetical protein